jgi:hypothetical protein
MTKLIGRSRGLWPSDGGSTGKASTPGMPMNFGKQLLDHRRRVALALLPVGQADEGDSLADGRVAGDDEIALDIGGMGVDVFELRAYLSV